MADKFSVLRDRLTTSMRGVHVHTLSELVPVVSTLIDVVADLEEKVKELSKKKQS